MRSIQARKKSFRTALAARTLAVRAPLALLAVSASVCLLALAGACGGKPDGDVKAPGDGTGASSSGGASSASGGASSGAASSSGADGVATSSGGTTTTNLPDGGELQGAKLGSSTHTEIETKGNSGPKAGSGHSQEPGRRREDIQTIVMTRRDEARACYDKGLKDHPGIEGDLTVKFVIDPTGVVTDATVDSGKSTINEPSVGACVVDVIKKIKFAPSKGGFETRANYPFNFHPKTFGKGSDAGAK